MVLIPTGNRWSSLDNGKHVGVSRDYLDIVEAKTGITFKQYGGIHTWSDSKSKFNNGEIKMLTAIAITAERQRKMDFTDPYLSFPFVIVTQNKGPYVGSMEDLVGKKIAVPKNYFIAPLLEEDDIDFQIVYKDNVEECLMSVST